MPVYLDKMNLQERPSHGRIILQGSDSSNVFFSDDLVYDDPNVLHGDFSSFANLTPQRQQGVMAGKQGFEQIEIPGTTTVIHGKFFAVDSPDDVRDGYHVHIYLELETA